MQSDFLLQALYISADDPSALIIEKALKRCGAKQIRQARNVAEAIDIIYKTELFSLYRRRCHDL